MDCHAGVRSCSHWRRAVVRRKPLLGIIAGRPRMLRLSGYRPNMFFTGSSLFLRRGARIDPALTAVVTDMVDRGLVHPGVVNVVDRVNVHVIHGRVVEKTPIVPAPALITTTEVAEAIVDPTIKTYTQAPVAFIEKKSSATPTPIARSPDEPHPCIFLSHASCSLRPTGRFRQLRYVGRRFDECPLVRKSVP